MVQLNTTYDSSIHQKVFVLKGDEAYARTTDTIATLITDFGDFDNHISYCHVGLEIQVLRELGDSHLLITVDGESLEPIPWSDSGMAEIIDSDWNEKGVYWIDGKLVIGKYEESDYSELDENDPTIIDSTGLYLLYDVEHKIEVRYEPNEYCLGSSAKPIVFTVPTPDKFASDLTFNKTNPRYAPNTTINDITLTLTCENDLTSAKSVKIYDDIGETSVLLDTVQLVRNTPLTLSLSGLEDGLHSIRAFWQGDDESYSSEKSIDVSVGYKIANLEYSSYILEGDYGYLSCNVLDYFNEAYENLYVVVVEDGTPISPTGYQTDGYGYVNVGNVDYSNNSFNIEIDGYVDSKEYATTIINPSSLQMSWNSPIVEMTYGSAVNYLTGYVLDGNNSPIAIEDIQISLHVYSHNYDRTFERLTDSNGKFGGNLAFENTGIVHTTATLVGTQITNTSSWIVPEHWWASSNDKQVGTYSADGGITVTKVSNGFKFESKSSSYQNTYFNYGSNSGVYIIEFDNITSSGTGSANILGYGMSMPVRGHYKFIHNLDNGTVKQYFDGREGLTWSYSPKRFELGCRNDYYCIIDNLVIVRSE